VAVDATLFDVGDGPVPRSGANDPESLGAAQLENDVDEIVRQAALGIASLADRRHRTRARIAWTWLGTIALGLATAAVWWLRHAGP